MESAHDPTTAQILNAYAQRVPMDALAAHVGASFDTVATVLLEQLMGLQVPRNALPGVFSQAWLIGDRSATLAFEELREATLASVAARRRKSTRAVAWAIISLSNRPLARDMRVFGPVDVPTKDAISTSARAVRQTSESVATEAEDLAQAYRDGRPVREIIERSRLPKGSAKRQLISALCGYHVAPRESLPTTIESNQLLADFGDQLRDDVRRGLPVEEVAYRAGLPIAQVAWLLVVHPARPLLDSEASLTAVAEAVRPTRALRSWPAVVGAHDARVRQVIDAFRGGQSVADIQKRSQLTFDELLEALLLGLTGNRPPSGSFDPIAARQFIEASGSLVVRQYDEGASINEIAADLEVEASLVAWSLIADPLARERQFDAASE